MRQAGNGGAPHLSQVRGCLAEGIYQAVENHMVWNGRNRMAAILQLQRVALQPAHELAHAVAALLGAHCLYIGQCVAH